MYDNKLQITLERYAESMMEAIKIYETRTEPATEELLAYIGSTGLHIKQFCDIALLEIEGKKGQPDNVTNIANYQQKK